MVSATKAKDYGQQRRLDDPKHPANKPRKPRAKKDTKRWCRGKVGREHVPVLDLPSFTKSYRKPPYCERRETIFTLLRPDWNGWTCQHIDVCAECGKTLRHELEPGECPDQIEEGTQPR